MAGLQTGTVKNGQVVGGFGIELGSLDVVVMECSGECLSSQ